MKNLTTKIIGGATVLGAMGVATILGMRLYRAYRGNEVRRQEDFKLDRALEQTMDCSDAVAVY